MSAPPMNPYYDFVSRERPNLGSYGQSQGTTVQEQRIEELEMTTFRALQAQADLEYQLEMAEARRRRLEQQQQRERTAVHGWNLPVVAHGPLHGTILVDRIVQGNTTSKPNSCFCCSSSQLLKLFLCFVATALLAVGIVLLIHFCFQ